MDREYIRINVGLRLRFNNRYAQQDLGWQFRPIENTLYDHFQKMIDDGVVQRPLSMLCQV